MVNKKKTGHTLYSIAQPM